jgi:hypothetical protein
MMSSLICFNSGNPYFLSFCFFNPYKYFPGTNAIFSGYLNNELLYGLYIKYLISITL